MVRQSERHLILSFAFSAKRYGRIVVSKLIRRVRRILRGASSVDKTKKCKHGVTCSIHIQIHFFIVINRNCVVSGNLDHLDRDLLNRTVGHEQLHVRNLIGSEQSGFDKLTSNVNEYFKDYKNGCIPCNSAKDQKSTIATLEEKLSEWGKEDSEIFEGGEGHFPDPTGPVAGKGYDPLPGTGEIEPVDTHTGVNEPPDLPRGKASCLGEKLARLKKPKEEKAN